MRKIVIVLVVLSILVAVTSALAYGIEQADLLYHTGHFFKYAMPDWATYQEDTQSQSASENPLASEWTVVLSKDNANTTWLCYNEVSYKQTVFCSTEYIAEGLSSSMIPAQGSFTEGNLRDDGSYVVYFRCDYAGMRLNGCIIAYRTSNSIMCMLIGLINTTASNTQNWNAVKMLAQYVTLLEQ